MQRLSVLVWISVILAIVPLLAIPLWLMKGLVVGGAVVMAGVAYSLLHGGQEDDLHTATPKQQKTFTASFDTDKPTDSGQSKDAKKEPVDITDPDADRFVATNTYKSRQNRLRN